MTHNPEPANNLMNRAKFRPVLSSELISHALSLARKDNSSLSKELIHALAIYEFKIANEIISPAYVESPRESLREKLGFDEDKTTIALLNAALASDEALYNSWLESPHLIVNPKELVRLRKYRYENNKMTEDEERLFEKEVLGMEI